MSDRPFCIQSWADLYQMLRAKAEASRGTVTIAAHVLPLMRWLRLGCFVGSSPHISDRDAVGRSLRRAPTALTFSRRSR